jgi:hypothetical protein
VKKVFAIFFAVLFVSGAASVGFSDDGAVTKNAEDSIFQKMSDVINDKYEVKTVPFKKIGIFQSMANGIDKVTRGSDDK